MRGRGGGGDVPPGADKPPRSLSYRFTMPHSLFALNCLFPKQVVKHRVASAPDTRRYFRLQIDRLDNIIVPTIV